MTVYTLFNQKGGVGKTTSAVLLTDYLVSKGRKVLGIDLDPQASFTLVLCGYNPKRNNLYHYFTSQILSPRMCLERLDEKLFFMPSSVSMFNLADKDSTELMKIKSLFNQVFRDFDNVVIDAPPSLGMFSRLALLLADKILIPVQTTQISYDSLPDALATIENMSLLNPALKDYLIFENQYTKRKQVSRSAIRDQYKKDHGRNWFYKAMPQNSLIEERMMGDKNFFSYLASTQKEQVLDFFNELEVRQNGKKTD